MAHPRLLIGPLSCYQRYKWVLTWTSLTWSLWWKCSLIDEAAVPAGWTERILYFPKCSSLSMASQILPVIWTSQFFEFSHVYDAKERKHVSHHTDFSMFLNFCLKLSSGVWFFRVLVFIQFQWTEILITPSLNIFWFFFYFIITWTKCLWVCFKYSSFSFSFCTRKHIEKNETIKCA